MLRRLRGIREKMRAVSGSAATHERHFLSRAIQRLRNSRGGPYDACPAAVFYAFYRCLPATESASALRRSKP